VNRIRHWTGRGQGDARDQRPDVCVPDADPWRPRPDRSDLGLRAQRSGWLPG